MSPSLFFECSFKMFDSSFAVVSVSGVEFFSFLGLFRPLVFKICWICDVVLLTIVSVCLSAADIRAIRHFERLEVRAYEDSGSITLIRYQLLPLR